MRYLLSLSAALWLLCLPAVASIISFTSGSATFLPGQDVTLSWSVTAGDSISINQGVPPIAGPSGSVTVLPAAAVTYILTDSTSGTTAQVALTPAAAPQMTHRWSFNEGSGTTVTDSVGTANGTIMGNGSTRTATQVVLPGGSPASAPYIDLPNSLISSLNQLTIEGWMTVSSTQNWSRVFDFGTGSSGEIFAPGGTPNGTEYLILTAQVGGDQNTKRLAMRDNNVENSVDLSTR